MKSLSDQFVCNKCFVIHKVQAWFMVLNFCQQFFLHFKFKLMADIHVETKKHNTIPAWIWILITLAVVVLVAFLLTRNNTTTTNENTGANSSKATSYVQPYVNSDANVVYYIG